ncbi:MAG: aldehyde dehydrogenase [Deltaproteobacteria bacterium RIFOXYA12_FULL_58_15]|nr:MAG: aldehyde dehydrogenase [Deltaproteobacteria bacterium RIFOXYA12_FULL_58_15]
MFMSAAFPSEFRNLEAMLLGQRSAHRHQPASTFEQRAGQLEALLKLIVDNQDRIAAAISADFGHRSPHESKLAEIFPAVSAIGHTLRNLREWMQPSRRRLAVVFLPATAKVHYRPLGVVGIISPWNYPFQLAILPLVAALSAGNRVMLKPSELTPATARIIEELLSELFSPEQVSVVTGGPDVGAAFSSLPFDHLFFTGSTRVGRAVMRAAAENLTPVTLELGGKSPAIVHESFPIDQAADRIAVGKTFNAGQTCIAPDYVLIPRTRVDEFAAAFVAAVTRRFPSLQGNDDYSSVIADGHRRRLQGLIDNAKEHGARVIEINPAAESFDDGLHKMPPTLILDATDEMAVMQEEIFGPVLPVIGYESLDDAIAYVGDRPKPLALYYFDYDDGRVQNVLDRTESGGVTINDTMLHVVQDDLPFGGVGESGMGLYHGHQGFLTFSHQKAVMHQSRLSVTGIFSPPYGKAAAAGIEILSGRWKRRLPWRQ